MTWAGSESCSCPPGGNDLAAAGPGDGRSSREYGATGCAFGLSQAGDRGNQQLLARDPSAAMLLG